MGIFVPEEVPLLSYENARRVEDAFTQKPMIVPLAPRPREVIFIRQDQNWVPIIAIVGLLGLFAFFGFLVYMRKS